MALHKYHKEDAYESEMDARSLMETIAILKDAKRLGRTQKALKKMDKEETEKSLERKVAAKLKKL